MRHKGKPPIHMGVKGRNDVGELFFPLNSVLFKRVLSDVPTRTVELTQPRHNVLELG